MSKYGQVFKDKVVARLLPPESASVEDVAQKTRVNVVTLERCTVSRCPGPPRGRAWTAASRLDAVLTTAALDETSRSLTRGVHAFEVAVALEEVQVSIPLDNGVVRMMVANDLRMREEAVGNEIDVDRQSLGNYIEVDAIHKPWIADTQG